MTRKFLTAASTVAVLMAAPAFAQSGSPEAEVGAGNVAASNQFTYDTNSPRVSSGYAEFDTNQIAMSQAAFRALSNSRGENLATTDGELIGVIEEVNVSVNGNPELVVQLTDAQAEVFNTDVLVVAVTPGNVMIEDNVIALATTRDDLVLAAEQGTVGSYADRKSVTLP